MTATGALLSVRGLTRRFGSRVILDAVDLDVRAGEAIMLTGANGTGKSTLLRILAGLERGAIESLALYGTSFALRPYPAALRRAIGYVHQHPALFATSVAGNIAYGLRNGGMNARDVAARTDAAIAWAGVGHVRNVEPAALSGGERQRVALARAKVLEPRLLLLDEPTSNLDGAAREKVIAMIHTLTEEGRSLIIVGHDRDLINLDNARRLKLRDGRLEPR